MKKTIVLRILLSLVALFFIAIGIIGFKDHLWHLLVVGFLILLLTLFWNGFKRRTNKSETSPLWKKIRTGILAFILLYALVDVGLIIAGYLVAQPDFSEKDELTVVVLGTDVDGDQPSDLLKPRLDTAAEYVNEHPDAKVIVTGKGRGEYTEAEVMYNYLIKKGVDASRIYQENQAQSTPENFSYSYEIIQEENLPKEVLVVTNNYHLMRATIYAKQTGISVKTLPAPTNNLFMLFPLSERERYIIVTEWLGLSPDLVNKHQEIQ